MMSEGGSPKALIDKLGLKKVADLARWNLLVDKVIAVPADNAARYREGKKSLLSVFSSAKSSKRPAALPIPPSSAS